MNDNILRSQNIIQRDPMQPVFSAGPAMQSASNPQANVAKSYVGDRRLQRHAGPGGEIDPFMMTTMQGNYDPTMKNKPKPPEPIDPLMGNFVSKAPGRE